MESRYCFRGRRHIRTLCYSFYTVFDENLSGSSVQLILSRARKCDITGNIPDAGTSFHIFCRRDVIEISLDSRSLYLFDLFDYLIINSVFIHDIAAGITHCNHSAAQLRRFLICINRNVSAAGNHDCLAFKRTAVCLEHLIGIITETVACGFRTGQ